MKKVNRAEVDITVTNELGLHARPASMLVRTASNFEADVTLVKGDESVNCKSVLGLMTLSAAKGTRLQIVAEGAADADSAVRAVAQHFIDNFGEE